MQNDLSFKDHMSFEEFKEAVAKLLVPCYGEGITRENISFVSTVKNHDTVLHGITVRQDGYELLPTAYLEPMYQFYQDDIPLHDIVWELVDKLKASRSNAKEADLPIHSFEEAKDKIRCRLVNTEWNKALLSDKPTTQIEDLSVSYHILVDISQKDTEGTVAISNKMLDLWGIDKETLHKQALENLSKEELSFKTMREALMETMRIEDIPELPDDEKMFCLTNHSKIHGAVAMLDEKMMKKVSDRIGGDFYILPSSVHEILIVRPGAGVNKRDLEEMVRVVNDTEVSPKDQLSNQVYMYDSVRKEIVLADKMEERIKEREAQQNENQNVVIRRHRGR